MSPTPQEHRRHRKYSVALAILCFVGFAVTSYGGIRSPDCEVVFRTAESLVWRGSFAVERDLELSVGFGVAHLDGKRYSVFGPLESVLLVPFVTLGEFINKTAWYTSLPIPCSQFVGTDFHDMFTGTTPADLRPHALRFIASLFNIIVSVLGVLMFSNICMALTGNAVASLTASLVLAFGTPLWAYSGTFFSEPLQILLLLAALLFVLRFYCAEAHEDEHTAASASTTAARRQPASQSIGTLAAAGVVLGLAATAHISAILFVPFFFLGVGLHVLPRYDLASIFRQVMALATGVLAVLLLLAVYNFLRFGNPFETGRGVDPTLAEFYGYGHFVAPWEGLRGFLISPTKSLMLYAPIVIVGLALWPGLHRRMSSLSIAILAAVLFRMFFIAARSDWHGGWAIGPRLLLVVVPFLLLPLSVWFSEQLRQRRLSRIAMFLSLAFVAMAQQLQLCMGELFSHYRLLVQTSRQTGEAYDMLWDWSISPALHGLEMGRGPYILMQLPLSNLVLWILGCVVIAGCLTLWFRTIQKSMTAVSGSRAHLR